MINMPRMIFEIRELLKGLLERNIITQEQHDIIHNRMGSNSLIANTAQDILSAIDGKEQT